MKTQVEVSTLSDESVLDKINNLSAKENQTTVELLLFLGELDKRRLYLPQGYSSLFDYCRRSLRYSEGAAQRRIVAARALAKYPELMELLLSKRITLCTLSLAAPILDHKNKTEIIEAISDKSRRDTEAALLCFRQNSHKPKESIRPVKNDRSVTKSSRSTGSLFAKKETKPTFCSQSVQKENAESLMELKFSISQQCFHKFQQVHALLSGKYPKGARLNQAFDEMLECYLEKHSPHRREQRQRAGGGATVKRAPQLSRSRHIPTALRDRVFMRDSGRCTYVGPEGQRCSSSHDIEVHHIHPWAKGGTDHESNLTLLCRAHNAYQAQCDFPEEIALIG